MKTIWKKIFSTTVATLVGCLAWADTTDTTATAWGDIKQWKPLGLRWAVGLGEQGQALAVYDLSYRNLGLPMKIGSLGGKALSVKQIIGLIRSAKNLDNADQAKLEDAAKDLGTIDDDSFGSKIFPKSWWQGIPWKSSVRNLSAEEPSSFRLSDMNLNLASKNSTKLQKALEEVNAHWAYLLQEEGGIEGDFASQIEFLRTGEGQYDIQWSPTTSQLNASAPRPKKMADIKCPKCVFLGALEWQLFEEAVGKAVDLVHVPIVQAILKVSTNRFFHFHKLYARTHENMFLEVMHDMRESTGVFPTNVLSAEEQVHAVEGTSYARTSLYDWYKWLWKAPYEEWSKEIKKGDDNDAKAITWFDDKKEAFVSLNSRFAMTNDQSENLYLMSIGKPNKKNGPAVAVDTANPQKTMHHRVAVEVLTTAVIFGSYFVSLPLVGSGITWLWDHFVESPVDHAKIFEGQLTAQLEQRSSQEKSWRPELQILDSQRINPFFQSREDMLELIAKRKQAIGL